MPPKPQMRLPVQAFIDAAGADNPSGLALQLGVKPKVVYRWIAEGGIPFYSADDLAVKVGLHPASVWGELYFDRGVDQGILDEAAEDARLMATWWSHRSPSTRRKRAEIVRGYDAVEKARERWGCRDVA